MKPTNGKTVIVLSKKGSYAPGGLWTAELGTSEFGAGQLADANGAISHGPTWKEAANKLLKALGESYPNSVGKCTIKGKTYPSPYQTS